MQTDSLANYMFMSKFIKNNQKDIQMGGGVPSLTTLDTYTYLSDRSLPYRSLPDMIPLPKLSNLQYNIMGMDD